MKGDFSRDTFQPNRYYTRVLLEQGRVQLDADWNEQQSIHQQQREQRTRDAVGLCGAPEGDPGFAVSASGSDLHVGRGRYYVDGILCEYDLAAGQTSRSISQQPHTGTAINLSGLSVGLVYLDVWERHVTWRDDSRIRERALGGPDTASRAQTIWQVKILPLSSRPDENGLAQILDRLRNGQGLGLAQWQNLVAPRNVTMNARTNVAAATTEPCILPPGAGYQGLENQLYRVEVHTGGPATGASFKWSRDNGMVAVDIESISGTEIIVSSTGRDMLTSFQSDDWVELYRDVNVLDGTPGVLLQVERVDSHERKITLRSNAPISLTAAQAEAQNAQLRRWNQFGPGATSNGVEMVDDWIHLENGVQVRFSGGSYRSGDFWLIPARTVTGEIEWPPFAIPNTNPAPQPPRGIDHHYCPLAIATRTAGTWEVDDLRLIFPPLTNIKASDVRYDNANCLPELEGAETVQEALDIVCRRGGGHCTFHVGPQANLATVFATIPDNQDAKICFAAGRYELNGTLIVSNKGHLVLEGCGPGSELVVSGRETAMAFSNCASVTVEKLRAVSDTADISAGNKGLRGVLTFGSCGQVSLREVNVRCAHGAFPTASCVTVRNRRDLPGDRLDMALVRIQQCHFEVGHMQTAVLLLNTRRIHVEDNVIDVVEKPARFSFERLVADDKRFRAEARRLLVYNAHRGAPQASLGANVTLSAGGATLHFATDPGLAQRNLWEELVRSEVRAGEEPIHALYRVADRILLRDTRTEAISAVRDWYGRVLQEDVSIAWQGVVVAGAAAEDTRILNNSVRGTLQGIHIGVSHTENTRGAPDRAGAVVVQNNHVEAFLPPGAVRERHGLFVGNCDSLLVEGNYLSLRSFRSTRRFRMEGIRIFGFLGKRMIIRHNHLDGFTPGMRINPLNVLGDPSNQPQWLVADNVAFVEVTADNTSVSLAAQRQRIRTSQNQA